MTGRELRERREKNGLTQQELATSLGISYATLSRWEREKTRPNRLYAKVVREFFEKFEQRDIQLQKKH